MQNHISRATAAKMLRAMRSHGSVTRSKGHRGMWYSQGTNVAMVQLQVFERAPTLWTCIYPLVRADANLVQLS